jgi:hypothetical protein
MTNSAVAGYRHRQQREYVISQGAGFKRTMEWLVWHADPGNVITPFQAGSNPHAPAARRPGARVAWCGLRGHGDAPRSTRSACT